MVCHQSFDSLHARLDDGIARNSEGQAVNDDATQLFALHVDSLPEAGGAEENGIRRIAKLLQQNMTRSRAVEKQRIRKLASSRS